MNPHEQSVTPAVLDPASRWNRRRLIVVIIVGVLAASILSYLALRHFILCGDCAGSPILCKDPCTLPTFGQNKAHKTHIGDRAQPAQKPPYA